MGPWAAQAGLGHLPQSITQCQPAQLLAPCSITALSTSCILVVIPAFPVSKVPVLRSSSPSPAHLPARDFVPLR